MWIGRQQATSSIQVTKMPFEALQNVDFGHNFIVLSQVEASNLYICVEKNTFQEFVCKIVPTRSYKENLLGYLRLDGHPGINTIEQVFVGPKQTFVTFKPSHGDLHSYVRNKKRLSEPEAISLFRQIAIIVNDCHENGICLRDLKLRKFVFRDAEKTLLKLETLDDAVVLEDPDDDLLGEKHGCPAYVSPEVLSTDSKYSGKSADCWSLGVILFTMLAGRYPFHDPNPSSLIGKIRRGLFQVPNSLSRELKCVIASLLRKDPLERMTTQDLLASHLFTDSEQQTQSIQHDHVINFVQSSPTSQQLHHFHQLPASILSDTFIRSSSSDSDQVAPT